MSMNPNHLLKQLDNNLNPTSIVTGINDFGADSYRFFNKCTKPDEKEFMKILKATMFGFLVLGVRGFLIKLVFIPVNNMFLGGL